MVANDLNEYVIMCSRVDGKIMVANNFVDGNIWLAAHLQNKEFEKACIAIWAIWNDRNGFCKDTPLMDWMQRCDWIHGYWNETRPKALVNTHMRGKMMGFVIFIPTHLDCSQMRLFSFIKKERGWVR